MSTSRTVRSSMQGWVVSDEGHRWSFKLDVRDLGGHLDTTFHSWSSTLASRVRLVISRLVLVSALPLDFHGRLRVLRSMFIPGALHGIEASFVAGTSLRKLRAAFLRVAWSRRQSFASVGAVLNLLDGLASCDPAFCVVWFRFRILRRYLGRFFVFIVCWSVLLMVVLVMVLFICFFRVRLLLGFIGILWNWLGVGLE